MSVTVKCRNGHEFEVTEDMLKPMNRAGMMRADCPDCGTASIMAFAKIAEILGTDVNGAKAYGLRKQNENPAPPKKVDVKPKKEEKPQVDYVQPSIEDDYPAGKEFQEILKKIDSEKERVESEVTRTRPVKVTTHDEGEEDPAETDPMMRRSTPFEDEFEKTPSDILETVLHSSQLDSTAKDDLVVYFRLRNFSTPTEGWQPKEVQSVLESYGIPKTIALKISNRYQFLLDTWTKKRNAATNLIGMLGDPAASFLFPGDRGSSGMYPHPSIPGGMSPGVPPMPGSAGQDTRQIEMQMVQAYQMNPQGFFNWLAYNPQYVQLWQRVVQSNPMIAAGSGMGMPMGMNPMMQMGMNPMMGGMPPRSGNNSGVSRDEVKRLVGAELDTLKSAIGNMLSDKAARDDNKHLVDAFLQLVKETQHRPEPVQQKPDETSKFISSLADKLITKQLEKSDGDPYLYALAEEVKELKKSLGEGTSFRKSMEDFEQYLKLQQLQFEMSVKKQEFEDKGKNREFIKSAIDKGIGAIGDVVMQLQQNKTGTSTAIKPPVQVSGVKTENTVTLPCSECGTNITFPKDAKSIVCPSCNSEYEAVPVQEPASKTQMGASASASGFILPPGMNIHTPHDEPTTTGSAPAGGAPGF